MSAPNLLHGPSQEPEANNATDGSGADASEPPADPEAAPAADGSPVESASRDGRDGRQRYRRVVKLADLRSNAVDPAVFHESFSDESIAVLAADIRHHGLRHPIEITEDSQFLDGERRGRALRRNGALETEAVVVVGVTTTEEIEAYVCDAHASTRDASLGERVRLFRLAQRVLSRRFGRPRGRPGKMVANDTIFWDRNKIKGAAARLAGFSSYATAIRAVRVINEGTPELRALLSAGEVTVNAAYDDLRRPRSADEPARDEDPDPPADQPEGAEGSPVDRDAEAPDDEPNVAANPFAESTALDLTPKNDTPDSRAHGAPAVPDTHERHLRLVRGSAGHEPSDVAEESDDAPADEDNDALTLLPGGDSPADEALWGRLGRAGRRVATLLGDAVQADYKRASEWYQMYAETLSGTFERHGR